MVQCEMQHRALFDLATVQVTRIASPYRAGGAYVPADGSGAWV